MDLFSRHWVVHEREGGFRGCAVISFETGEAHRVRFRSRPIPYGTGNAEFDTDSYRFAYESLVTPDSVFDYDLNTRSRKLLKQEEVLGGYNPAHYHSELTYATALDGTQIPVSMVYRKDLPGQGAADVALILRGIWLPV